MRKITISLTYMYICSQSQLGTGGIPPFTLIVKPNATEVKGVRSSKESIYFAKKREVSIRARRRKISIRPINMHGTFSSYGKKGKLPNYCRRVITSCSNQPFSLCKHYQFCGSRSNTAMSGISNFTPSRSYSSDLDLTDVTSIMAQVNLGDVVITLATTWSISEGCVRGSAKKCCCSAINTSAISVKTDAKLKPWP